VRRPRNEIWCPWSPGKPPDGLAGRSWFPALLTLHFRQLENVSVMAACGINPFKFDIWRVRLGKLQRLCTENGGVGNVPMHRTHRSMSQSTPREV